MLQGKGRSVLKLKKASASQTTTNVKSKKLVDYPISN